MYLASAVSGQEPDYTDWAIAALRILIWVVWHSGRYLHDHSTETDIPETPNQVFRQQLTLGFVGPCIFTHSNESTNQMQQLITGLLFVA